MQQFTIISIKSEIFFYISDKLEIVMSHNWIEEFKKDENQSISNLYRKYRVEIVFWIKKNYGLKNEDACDVFQNSVIQLYNNIVSGKLDGKTLIVKPYLLGICRYKALEICRNNKFYQNHIPLDSNSDIPIIEDRTYNQVLSTKIKTMKNQLVKLGNPCKYILEKFYFNNWTIAEITLDLGYKNTNTTKNMKYKCLKRLLLAIN